MHREQKSVYIVFLRAVMHLSGGSNHACLWIMTQWTFDFLLPLAIFCSLILISVCLPVF